MPCDTPFYVTPKGWTHDVPVPCGRCPPCKKRRVDGWVFRLMQEDKVSTSAHFVTLTYDTEHVPLSENGWMTLTRGQDVLEDLNGKSVKVDNCCFTKFMKRLRKISGVKGLKYYACGEYGSENKRPHWHAIIFNVPDPDMFFQAWSLGGKPFGTVHVGQVTGDSIAYCMKYIDKPGGAPLYSGWIPFFGRDDREPEFALMSKGLGRNYVSSAVKKYHLDDYSRLYCVNEQGYKIALPRYYRSLIYDADDSGFQRSLVESAAADADGKNFELFVSRYGKVPNYTYEQFCESQRLARYESFYSNQKVRYI